MIFYLGCYDLKWLRTQCVPLFISLRIFKKTRKWPVATCPWALDSGAFSEIAKHGRWTLPVKDYVSLVRRIRDEVGLMEWAAPQDWMCEPAMIARTGLTVKEHQKRTTQNFCELIGLAPDLPFVPVLQGWTHQDYLNHVDLYAQNGVTLSSLPLVGLGSVCRRQKTTGAEDLIRDLHGKGIRLHGFGFKISALGRCARYLESADSMAWSFNARRSNIRLRQCVHKAKKCHGCSTWAMMWRERVLRAVASSVGPEQRLLF